MNTITVETLRAAARLVQRWDGPAAALRDAAAAAMDFAVTYAGHPGPDYSLDAYRPEVPHFARAFVLRILESIRDGAPAEWPDVADIIETHFAGLYQAANPYAAAPSVERSMHELAVALNEAAAGVWAQAREAARAPAPAVLAPAVTLPRTPRLVLLEGFAGELRALGVDAGPLTFAGWRRDLFGACERLTTPGTAAIVDPATSGDVGAAVLRSAGVYARGPVAVIVDPELAGAAVDALPDVHPELRAAIRTTDPQRAIVLVLAGGGGAVYRWGEPPELHRERPLAADPVGDRALAGRIAALRAGGASREHQEAAWKAGA